MRHWIAAEFWRGGTSKGLFFHARDLPADPGEVDALMLAAIGSPDPNGRQLDGMGGGISSLSKGVIIGPSSRPDADLDYTFAQLSVDRAVADRSGNCGNLSAAVGPFAVDAGLVAARNGEALVRIHQTNTGRIIESRFAVRDGLSEASGDYAIDGVAGTGARIRLDFLDPGGSATGALLPTGRAVDRIVLPGAGSFAVSLVDAAAPVAWLEAEAVGLDGTETPEQIESRPELMALLDRIRRQAGVMMGMAETPEAVPLLLPRVAVVSGPAPFRSLDGRVHPTASHDIATRVLSMERPHRATPLTAGLCLGVACRIPGTVPHRLARQSRPDEVRLAHPSGLLSVGAEIRREEGLWRADSAVVYRTARCLMRGQVALPPRGQVALPQRGQATLPPRGQAIQPPSVAA